MRLTLNADGTWERVLPAAFGDSAAGTWAMDDGFVRMDDGTALWPVTENLLRWARYGLAFTREPCSGYQPGEVLTWVSPSMFAGYWKCAFADVEGVAAPAEILLENTDLYIAGDEFSGDADEPEASVGDGSQAIGIPIDATVNALPVALGGPRFGDIFWIFGFTNGVLSLPM